MDQSTRRDRDARLAFFKGLDEKQVRALYELAAIKKIQPDTVLFKEGDRDKAVYVILEGKIKIEKRHHQETKLVEILRDGDYIGGIDYIGDASRTTTAIAVEPSSVMKIDNETMAAFDEKSQIFFLKLLYDSASSKIRQLENRERELSVKNTLLMKEVFYERAQKKMDFSKSEIIQGLVKKIPKLPVFASSLVTMLVDERTSAEDLTEQIRNDPSLVGTVLKTVNSPYYGFRQKISDIHRAIVMLGFNEMYQLIVSEGVRQSMPKTPEFQKVHSHCIAISRIAAIISQETHVGRPAEMATIGLLHDIGHVVIQLLIQQNAKFSIFIDALDPAQLGSLLLRSWNLPEIICGCVRFQSYPEFVPPQSIDPEIRDNVILLYLSHLCLEYFQKNKDHGLSTIFLEDYTQLIDLKEYSVDDICRVWILPGLKKNMESLPVSLKRLIKSDE